MSVIISPNMSLVIPGVGSQPGPTYASNINSSLNIIDAHDHSPGNGVQITPSGLDINADLSMQTKSLTSIGSLIFQQQSSPISASIIDALYDVNGDLYFNDGLGNQIPITANGAVAGTPGSIANLVAPASASYVALTDTFVWQSDVNVAANMDVGSIKMRNLTAGSDALTLSPPTLSSSYNIVLPTLPSANNAVVLIGTTGIMSTGVSESYFTPAGVISMYGGSITPTGWLACNGAAVSRTTYAALLAAIGTAYGSGDGSTTFNVPDMRGMFPRGVSGASGNDPDANSRPSNGYGGASGNTAGSVQSSAYAAHNHSINDPGHTHEIKVSSTTAGGEIRVQQDAPRAGGSNSANQNGNSGVQSATTGITATNNSGGSTETRPINVYVNFIIKT